jgi:TPR repeat protein
MGVQPWQEEGVELLKKAACRGHAYAMNALGDMYDARKEHEQALTWYTKSAEAGLPVAMYALADVHGAREEYEQAVKWYTMVWRCWLNL